MSNAFAASNPANVRHVMQHLQTTATPSAAPVAPVDEFSRSVQAEGWQNPQNLRIAFAYPANPSTATAPATVPRATPTSNAWTGDGKGKEPPSAKRREQNREAAQRYRERRENAEKALKYENAAIKQENEALKARYTRTNTMVATLQQEKEALEKEKEALKMEKEALENAAMMKENEALKAENTRTNKMVATLQQEKEALEKEKEVLEKEKAALKQEKEAIQTQHEREISELKAVLSRGAGGGAPEQVSSSLRLGRARWLTRGAPRVREADLLSSELLRKLGIVGKDKQTI